jgi:hypothetical protein
VDIAGTHAGFGFLNINLGPAMPAKEHVGIRRVETMQSLETHVGLFENAKNGSSRTIDILFRCRPIADRNSGSA